MHRCDYAVRTALINFDLATVHKSAHIHSPLLIPSSELLVDVKQQRRRPPRKAVDQEEQAPLVQLSFSRDTKHKIQSQYLANLYNKILCPT